MITGPSTRHRFCISQTTFSLALVLTLMAFGGLTARPMQGAGINEIIGTVYLDGNENGQREADEVGLANVMVALANEKGILLSYTYTDDQGEYYFRGMASGVYLLSENNPEGYTSTTPDLVRLDVDHTAVLQHNYGDVAHLPGCFRVVSGHIWHDTNGNAAQDTGEEPLGGIGVRVLDTLQHPVALAVSDANGQYAAKELPVGQYYVLIDAPDAMSRAVLPLYWGVDVRGCFPAQIDIGLWANGEGVAWRSRALQLARAAEGEACSVSGQVWIGTSGNAPAGRGISGVKLTLRDEAGHLVAEQRTDATGVYRFAGLAGWQRYTLTQEPVAGMEAALSRYWGVAVTAGSDVLIDLENWPTPGAQSHAVFLPSLTSSH